MKNNMASLVDKFEDIKVTIKTPKVSKTPCFLIAEKYIKARVDAKITHWFNRKGSYGKHIGLDIFYDETDDYLDEFIECFLSGYEIDDPMTFTPEPSKEIPTDNLVSYFENLYSSVEGIRYDMGSSTDKVSYLQSLLDNLQSETKHLIYRIKRFS